MIGFCIFTVFLTSGDVFTAPYDGNYMSTPNTGFYSVVTDCRSEGAWLGKKNK